jgi:trafficking protein particle complex subunit 9
MLFHDLQFIGADDLGEQAGGSRSGELSFRQQRMTLPMLETLRTEAVRIHLELFHRGGEASKEHMPILRKGGTYHPAPYEFVYLRMRITNLSRKLTSFWRVRSFALTKSPGGLRVSAQPLLMTVDTAVDPADHAIQEGTPSGTPIGRLESDAVCELETPLCFVACGQFHIHVMARAIRATVREAVVGFAMLKAVVQERNPGQE